jgi:8-oxo-dGTP pyrophosphatase MutT (NUDIX family)
VTGTLPRSVSPFLWRTVSASVRTRGFQGAGSLALVAHDEERTRWKVLGERVVDENPLLQLSVATVELPDGTVFGQYVMRTPRGAMTVVLDDDAERVLLIWRHRFVTGQWLWELPGGFIDPGEDGPAAAAREVEEETGYRPRSIEPILTFHPIAGTADTAYELYLARGADHVGTPDPNETEAVRWIPLTELPGLIIKGEISGAATIIGIQHVLLTAGRGHHA